MPGRFLLNLISSLLVLGKQPVIDGMAAAPAEPAAAGAGTADELKKFKVLLDSGVITQEEFDAKKKELLGL